VPSPVIAGVSISHPDRLVYPELGLTKLDVVRYYERVAAWMLPHIQHRPLTLVHCPEGLTAPCRYLRHVKTWGPKVLRRVTIREQTKVGEYLIAVDHAGIIGLAQMSVLEIHTWNSTFEDVERPNRLIWDLDPGPEVPWREVVKAAHTVRELLTILRLRSWVKTTGGKGLHVVAPIVPSWDWAECLAFAKTVAEALTRSAPDRFTTAFAKRGREDKILIDYLRNNRTNTSVAAFSTRARPCAAVSMPITWEELTPKLKPSGLTVQTVPRRLARLKTDPWADYWTCRQRVSLAAKQAIGAI